MITDERQALAAVDAALDGFLAERISRASTVGPSCRRLWERIGLACSGGKRIRPRLLLLAHNTLGGDAHDDAVTASVAFELLHTAFLLHDDVLDGDLVRRGRPNLQGSFVGDAIDRGLASEAATAWGDAAGVLAGDLLISAAHSVIARITADARTALHELIDGCLFSTAAGELADVGLALGAVDVTIPEITRMMHDKTAVYSFAAPLRAGALLAGAGAQAETELAEIGTMLGFVYQLRDDLLGVFGSPAALGKPVDGDLREGKQTLLIAYAEGSEAWNDVRHLFGRRSLDADTAERLRGALVECGARARVELHLSRQCEKTCERIEQSGLPERLKAELIPLARRCAERES
jgi:geranylgeranyl diphosphate synthase type II